MKKLSTEDIPRNWTVKCVTRSGKEWTKDFAMDFQAVDYASEMERKYKSTVVSVFPALWDGNRDNYNAAYARAMECQENCYKVARGV